MLPSSLVVTGDCLDVLTAAPANGIDFALVDPPYGLSADPDIVEVVSHWLRGEHYIHPDRGGFMGKEWDSFVPGPDYWRQVFRVLKPGAFAFVFAGTRTQDLMTLSLRFAGFKVKDVADWLYGTGFPKSRDVSKDVDAKLGAERPVVGSIGLNGYGKANAEHGDQARNTTEFAVTSKQAITDEAKRFAGFGTALKPAREPIIIVQKPLEGTYAENLLKWGTGALNIDAARIADETGSYKVRATMTRPNPVSGDDRDAAAAGMFGAGATFQATNSDLGRWPANVILDEEAADALVEQAGEKARRFFYCAKVSKRERDVGCDSLPLRSGGEATDREDGTAGLNSPRAGAGRGGGVRNRHPTVKPVRLLRYLIRLGCPPGGVVLDNFCGSGSSGAASALEGSPFIGIEKDPESAATARLRIAAAEEIRRETEP